MMSKAFEFMTIYSLCYTVSPDERRHLQWHCQLHAKNGTSVQEREDDRWFWAFLNPCIFAAHAPSHFLQGKVSGRDFQYVDHAPKKLVLVSRQGRWSSTQR